MGYSVYPAPSAAAKEKRIALFTSTGSWTAPAGVNYAIAHILAGGGGGGSTTGSDGAVGGTSSCFGQNALGGRGGAFAIYTRFGGGPSGQANTGNGGSGGQAGYPNTGEGTAYSGADASELTFGSAVTPGSSYTVTVGAGGSGSGNGGSGRVSIEYWV